MTDRLDEFSEMLNADTFDRRVLTEEPTMLTSQTLGVVSTKFVQNLRIQRAVPQVEANYSGNKVVEDVRGEILRLEDGELISEEAIAGYEYPTDGFVLVCDRSDLRSSKYVDVPEDILSAGYSAGYALRNVIARRLGINTMEIQCAVQLTHSEMKLTIYDNESGGAGLCHPMYQDIVSILNEAHQLLARCTCREYCESCLLIPRASEYLLQHDLLNRNRGIAFFELTNR